MRSDRPGSTTTTTPRDELARQAALSRLTSSEVRAVVTVVTALAGQLARIHHLWHVLDERGAWRIATADDLRKLTGPLISAIYGVERGRLARLHADLYMLASPEAERAAALFDIDDLVADVDAYAVLLKVDKHGRATPRYWARELSGLFQAALYQQGGHIEQLRGDGFVPVLHALDGGKA